MWKDIRITLLTGLVVLLPTALTLILIFWMLNKVDAIFRKPLEALIGFQIYGLGVFITLCLVFGAGFAARRFTWNNTKSIPELVFGRIPLVRTIYYSIKQLTETIYGSKKTSFREAVLVEYPSKGIYMIAFITARGLSEVEEIIGEEIVSLFIPTTPNPTSGLYVILPRKDITPLKISVEEAIKLVISGGIVKPSSPRGGRFSTQVDINKERKTNK
ncbi:MAG: DUF502 domain-containing protein [Alkaliphilus sp.]